MGCCPSSPYKADHAATHHHPSRSDHSRRSKVAPPEEETVKEVLSETPIAKINQNEDKQRGAFNKPVQKQDDPKKFDNKTPFMNNNAEEASEASEICSLSEVSVSTAADGGGEEVRRRVVNRSPAKFRSGERRDRATAGGKSPARRSDPSPARRSDPSPGRVRSVSQRRDTGESSGRRSMSPATRSVAAESGGGGRVGMGRSLSARRTGKSPGRVQGKTRKFEESSEGEGGNGNSSNKWGQQPTGDESLENPLVSLECFIFL